MKLGLFGDMSRHLTLRSNPNPELSQLYRLNALYHMAASSIALPRPYTATVYPSKSQSSYEDHRVYIEPWGG